MTKKISEAIKTAREYMQPDDETGRITSLPEHAIAWALIAIAEALLEQNKQAELQAELEEMRQERQGREFTPPF